MQDAHVVQRVQAANDLRRVVGKWAHALGQMDVPCDLHAGVKSLRTWMNSFHTRSSGMGRRISFHFLMIFDRSPSGANSMMMHLQFRRAAQCLSGTTKRMCTAPGCSFIRDAD
jgi:hypothetical protein